MVPFSKHTITSVDELFGRDDLVEKLIAYAKRKENVALIGTRRFGKTCIFRSLINFFHGLEDSPVFPIFLDFKEVSEFINGTPDVYRFIVARLIEELCKADVYTKKEDFPSLDITPSKKNWADNFDNLSNFKIVKLNSVMSEMIKEFSNLMDKTILFMIDEYEHLFVKSFTNPEGFMPLRSLSSENEKDRVKPFAFWIAGAVGWKELCTQIGSAELNVINASINLMPLEKADFESMWKHEVSLCPEEDKNYLMNKMDFAYQKTGGVPYYAKILGAELIVNKKEPDYTILMDYFDTLYYSLDEEERKYAKEIAVLPRNYKELPGIKALQNKGLIFKNGNKFEIQVGFFSDYLKMMGNERPVADIVKNEELADAIFSLFKTINDQRKNKRKAVIFDRSSQDLSLYKDMKTPCQNAHDFEIFIKAVYLTFLEKTKTDGKTGNNLPTSIRFGAFGQAIDILRHVYIGHLEDKLELNYGQMTKADAFQFFLDSVNEPYHPEEFKKLQIVVLEKYKEELVNLLHIVRNEK